MPLFEYICPHCGAAQDSLQSYPPPDTLPCDCGETSELRFPMPASTPSRWSGNGYGAVVKQSGPRDERPPNAMNTEPLANGVSHRKWKLDRKKKRAAEIRQWCKDNT